MVLRRYFRQKRYQYIDKVMHLDFSEGFILDLGGGPASFFAALFPRPEAVILADVDYKVAKRAKEINPALQVVLADGCHLPLANCSVKATVCNSVIEHVATPSALATEIRRVSQSYFLQTPNGQFPAETHSFIAIPFYHLIPWMSLSLLMCKIFGANFEYVNSVRYLSEETLNSLFPEATLAYEKSLGLKKSFYVFRVNKEE